MRVISVLYKRAYVTPIQLTVGVVSGEEKEGMKHFSGRNPGVPSASCGPKAAPRGLNPRLLPATNAHRHCLSAFPGAGRLSAQALSPRAE